MGGISMSNLTMVREFFILKDSFENGDFSLRTVSDLIVTIRENRNNLTGEQAALLLDIPLNVLEYDVELTDKGSWQESNRGYFLGNMGVDTEYVNELRQKITVGSFSLKDIYDLTKYVQENFKDLSLGADFLLRNAEVTLRDDVKLHNYSTFNKSGKAFAHYIQLAFS